MFTFSNKCMLLFSLYITLWCLMCVCVCASGYITSFRVLCNPLIQYIYTSSFSFCQPSFTCTCNNCWISFPRCLAHVFSHLSLIYMRPAPTSPAIVLKNTSNWWLFDWPWPSWKLWELKRKKAKTFDLFIHPQRNEWTLFSIMTQPPTNHVHLFFTTGIQPTIWVSCMIAKWKQVGVSANSLQHKYI